MELTQTEREPAGGTEKMSSSEHPIRQSGNKRFIGNSQLTWLRLALEERGRDGTAEFWSGHTVGQVSAWGNAMKKRRRAMRNTDIMEDSPEREDDRPVEGPDLESTGRFASNSARMEARKRKGRDPSIKLTGE